MASELIERDIYGGKYHLTHNPNARGSQPRYVLVQKNGPGDLVGVRDARKPKGVTTIMGQVLAKDLMQWAADCAVGYIKDLLPVVTEADLKEAAKAYTVKRDKGASTGSEAHALVEQYLKEGAPQTGSSTQEAKNAYNAFVKWFEEAKPEVINVEEVIYSEAYDFAGTYDAMMRIDGKVYLTDLKTTNASRKAPKGIYPDYFIQLGLYALAHEERRVKADHDLPQVDGLMVISAKKNGKMDLCSNEDVGLTLEDCMGMGRRVVDLFRFLQYTTAKLGGK